MSSVLDLVVLNGPREGDTVQLDPDRKLVLGRSAKGYQLVDPLVSLNHAEVTWQGDCYWVEDTGSATGTFVNDMRIDKPVMLVTGMRLRLGETMLEVRPRPHATLRRVFIGVGVALVCVFAFANYRRNIVVEYDPKVVWYQPVHQGVLGVSPVVKVPNGFIRTTGVDHRGLTVERVTDFDGDGVDELWLAWKTGKQVVTFGPDGEWTTIGALPADCKDSPVVVDESIPAECVAGPGRVKTEMPEVCQRYQEASAFPELDCTGIHMRHVDGRYTISSIDGVIAWLDPTEKVKNEEASKKAKKDVFDVNVLEGPPVPYLFSLAKVAQLAGFLSDRGIFEPVHYVVCEDALPGMKPQVRLASGAIVPLGVGCLGDLDIIGATRQEEFGTVRPRMVAFTGNGARALVRDLGIYLSGTDDETFMDKASAKVFAAVGKAPIRRQGAIRVVFDGSEQIGNPLAPERPLVGVDRLAPAEFASARPERAWTVIMPTAGRYDLEGCSELDVRFTDWHCVFSKGCGPEEPFMQIQNTGCGSPKKTVIPFKPGERPYNDGVLKGRILVEAEDSGRQIDVLRVKMVYSVVGDDPS